MSVGTVAPRRIIAENANVRNGEFAANGAGAQSWQHRRMRDSYNVRVHVELGRHAIKTGAVLPLRMWLLLRYLDADGRGVVGRQHFLDMLRFHGLSQAHLRTAVNRQRALYDADVFFTVSHDKVEYRSLEAVCSALQVAPGRSVYLPVTFFRQLGTLTAHLYAAWHSVSDDRVISRATLTDLFGASPMQQWRWEKIAGVEKSPTVAPVAEEDMEAATRFFDADDRQHKEQDDAISGFLFVRDGELWRRLPNRYTAYYARGNQGRGRKAAKVAHAAAKRASIAAGGLDDGAAKTQGDKRDRRYFEQRHWNSHKTLVRLPGVTDCYVRRLDDAGKPEVFRSRHGAAAVYQYSQRKPYIFVQ